MDSPFNAISVGALSRRQFGRLLGGGAVLLAVGGSFGVIASSERGAAASAATRFGRISILRAGRFARLDSRGRTASSNLIVGAAYLGGQVTDRARPPRARDSRAQAAAVGHGHEGGQPEPPRPQPLNLTWGDVVVLEVEARNEAPQPVLFSPGQLRLTLGQSNTTVTAQDCDRGPGALGANTTAHFLVTYLAPHVLADFELEFTDGLQDQPVRLTLPPLAGTEVFS